VPKGNAGISQVLSPFYFHHYDRIILRRIDFNPIRAERTIATYYNALMMKTTARGKYLIFPQK
jgi:hypothetical protein